MLREVTIENFKSLRQAKVELKPLTIIIGPNATGKSNFLEGLEALQRLVQYKGTTRPGREGDRPVISIDEVLWRKAPPDERISWGLNVELQPVDYPRQLNLFENNNNEGGQEQLLYTLTIKNAGVDEEQLPIIDIEKLVEAQHSLTVFSRQESNITIQMSQRNGFPPDTEAPLSVESQPQSIQSEISGIDLALHFYARESLPVVRHLRDYIQRWEFYRIVPQLIRSPISSYRGKQHTLVKYGSNLANVLHYLHDKQPADFEYIQDEMRSALQLSQLYTKEEDQAAELLGKPSRIYLEAQEQVFADSKPFGPDQLSDGTLGFLALLTILGVSNPSPLICLEEPERSIHIHLIPRLAHYLHEAAARTQLIITTHSPELLDQFDPYEQDYVQVLIAHRDSEGATQFIPIHQVQNVRKWLDDYMLGQVWTMGQIEELLEVA